MARARSALVLHSNSISCEYKHKQRVRLGFDIKKDEGYIQNRAATTSGASRSNCVSLSRALLYPRWFLVSNLTIIEWSASIGTLSSIESGSWRSAESVSTAVTKSPVRFQRLLARSCRTSLETGSYTILEQASYKL
jgi:hypothetical protein